MKVKDLANWEAFQYELQVLRTYYGNPSSPLLFRGQPDSEFRLTTTLERAGCEDMSFSHFYLLVSRTRPAVETFTGVEWQVPEYSRQIEESFHDVELFTLHRFPPIELYRYLVYLRHHGFPSPLLDWSRSPYIAAFFAFRDLGSGPRVGNTAKRSIYVYCEMPEGHKGS